MSRYVEWLANQYALLSRLATNDLRSKRPWTGMDIGAIVDGTSTQSYSKRDLRELFNFSDANSYIIRGAVKQLPIEGKTLLSILETPSSPTLPDFSGLTFEEAVAAYCAYIKFPSASELACRFAFNYRFICSGEGFILYTRRTAESARRLLKLDELSSSFILNYCVVRYRGKEVVQDIY